MYTILQSMFFIIDKPKGFYYTYYIFSGWFLAPICFGFIIDTTCLIWNTSCAGQGACALYNAKDFRFRFFGIFFISKTLALLLMILVYFKARTKTDWSVEEQETSPEEEINEMIKTKGVKNDEIWQKNNVD